MMYECMLSCFCQEGRFLERLAYVIVRICKYFCQRLAYAWRSIAGRIRYVWRVQLPTHLRYCILKLNVSRNCTYLRFGQDNQFLYRGIC